MVASAVQGSGFSAGGAKSAWSAVAVELSTVVSRPTEWLWKGRLPLGKLTLLAGDPGLGKSFLTVDLAARVTTGRAWPDGSPCSGGDVIFLNAEDELDDTLCPRLEKAGADLSKCVAITASRSNETGLVLPLSLARDLASMRQILLTRPHCKLIVIDPISAYMGYTDSNSNTEVRSLLFPLAQLAAEFRVAVVAVTHLNKRGTGRAIYRAMGSLAFVAAARSAFTVVRDPEDEERHLLLPVKSNLAMKASGLAYRFKADSELAVATIDWEAEPVDAKLDELLNQRPTCTKADRAYRDSENYAETWLRQALEEGPRPRSSFFPFFMRPLEISDQQLYRAAERLGVVKVKESLSNDSWLWALPEHTGELRDQVADGKTAQRAEKVLKEEAIQKGAEGLKPPPETKVNVSSLMKMMKAVETLRSTEPPQLESAICTPMAKVASKDATVVHPATAGSTVAPPAAAEPAAVSSSASSSSNASVANASSVEAKPTEDILASMLGMKPPLPGMPADTFEEMMRRIEFLMTLFRKSLQRKGRHLNEKEWANFCADLRSKERYFLEDSWQQVKDRLYQAIADTPLGATIRNNNGQWPKRPFDQLSRAQQRNERKHFFTRNDDGVP
jgi:hypothetical protein